MKVRLDPDNRQGHPLRALDGPDAFALHDFDGHAAARFEAVPAVLPDAVRDRPATCPEQAIEISD